jgi:hypothetical protein
MMTYEDYDRHGREVFFYCSKLGLAGTFSIFFGVWHTEIPSKST